MVGRSKRIKKTILMMVAALVLWGGTATASPNTVFKTTVMPPTYRPNSVTLHKARALLVKLSNVCRTGKAKSLVKLQVTPGVRHRSGRSLYRWWQMNDAGVKGRV